MPIAATKHTDFGAEQFATFFVKTIDWGYATTSSAYMRHYFTKTCSECERAAQAIDSTRDAGLHYLGGRLTTKSSEQLIVTSRRGSSEAVKVVLDVAAASAVDAKGAVKGGDVPKTNQQAQVYLQPSSHSWTVVLVVFAG